MYSLRMEKTHLQPHLKGNRWPVVGGKLFVMSMQQSGQIDKRSLRMTPFLITSLFALLF